MSGITGFVGSHLAEYILSLKEGHKIYGLCRWRSPRDNLKNCIREVHLLEGDLLDFVSLERVLYKSKPDIIFHLAAQSYVQTSFTSPIDTMQRNVIGTVNLLEAVRELRKVDLHSQKRVSWSGLPIIKNKEFDPIIQIASSSEVYGDVSTWSQPTDEATPLKPSSPYAVSKVAVDMLGYQYHKSYEMKILRTRLFSHSGARRGDVFVLSAFAKQVATIELGLQKPEIRVGNLNSSRTFIDVRDAVSAYWMLVTKVKAYGDVFNIGGNEEVTINRALIKLIFMSNLIKDEISIVCDTGLMRPSDVTSQIPDSSKFRSLTGWKPTYTIDDTLKGILDYWRKELRINPWKVKSVDK